ncbi:MAG: hypothetical protein DVB26_05635 [Verrucomicrobia bacterium]|nr:MAG: hypothetical protein DVB26_05635 [Verrucomicrobiota bacterium]
MKIKIAWKPWWWMLGAVACCHWEAILPAPALDEPAAVPAGPILPPVPPLPPTTPKDAGVIPNVQPQVLPNVVPAPNTPDEPATPDPPDKSEASDKSDKSDKISEAPDAFVALANSPLASGFGDSVAAGLTFTPTLSGTYDSNVLKGQRQSSAQSKGDFFGGLGGDLKYLSMPGALTYGGNYRGRYDEYVSHSELSGYSQGGGFLANYKRDRFTLSATAGIDENRGSAQNFSSNSTFGGTSSSSFNQNYNQTNFYRLNRSASLVGNYEGGHLSLSANIGYDFDQQSNNYASSLNSSLIETTSLHSGLSARYLVSAKTSLTGNFDERTSTAAAGNYGDTSSYTLGTAALWKYSPLTEIGPGIHYLYNSNTAPSSYGRSTIGRSSIGPTLNLNYKLDVKVSMTSQVGLDFNRYDSGQTADPTLSGSLGLNYQASTLWGMNLSLARNVQADPTRVGAFYQNNSLRLGCNRKLLRSTLSLGAFYQGSSSIVPAGMTNGRPNSDILGLDSSLSMPLFADKGSATVFVRYNEQSGVNSSYGSIGNSWNSCQTGFSLSYRF